MERQAENTLRLLRRANDRAPARDCLSNRHAYSPDEGGTAWLRGWLETRFGPADTPRRQRIGCGGSDGGGAEDLVAGASSGFLAFDLKIQG